MYVAKDFTKLFLAAALATSLWNPSIACESDADCGNLDCIRVGFKKACAPVSCAKGAAQALLESGFNAGEYISNIRGGLRNRDVASLGKSEENQRSIEEAMRANPPSMAAFEGNFTACANPTDASGVEARATETRTIYGLQWSAAAVFAYFGKSTWDNFKEEEDGFEATFQYLQNCVGAVLGGDVGLDFLIQIFTNETPDSEATNGVGFQLNGIDGSNIEKQEDMKWSTELNYIPVATLGPFGIQVGLPGKDDDASEFLKSITEITLGPSLGANILGYTRCFTDITLSFPDNE